MIICINHACSIGFKMTNHPLLLSKTFEPALRQTAKHLIITLNIRIIQSFQQQHITHKELFLHHHKNSFSCPTYLYNSYFFAKRSQWFTLKTSLIFFANNPSIPRVKNRIELVLDFPSHCCFDLLKKNLPFAG